MKYELEILNFVHDEYLQLIRNLNIEQTKLYLQRKVGGKMGICYQAATFSKIINQNILTDSNYTFRKFLIDAPELVIMNLETLTCIERASEELYIVAAERAKQKKSTYLTISCFEDEIDSDKSPLSLRLLIRKAQEVLICAEDDISIDLT